MPGDIKQAIEMELAKNPPATPTPTPAPAGDEPEKIVEENQPTPKPEVKADDPAKPEGEAKPEEAKNEPAKIELDKKFVTYERFKDINEKYKALKLERDEAMKNKQPLELDEDAKEERERLKKLGMVTQEEADENKFQMRQEQLKEEEQQILDKEFKKLERDFDGSDGLPKFSKDDVMNRGIANQVFDPKSAYIVMNLPTIINHFVKKAMVDVKKQPTFGKPNEIRQPDITPTDRKSLKGVGLQNFLEGTINAMMGK